MLRPLLDCALLARGHSNCCLESGLELVGQPQRPLAVWRPQSRDEKPPPVAGSSSGRLAGGQTSPDGAPRPQPAAELFLARANRKPFSRLTRIT